MGDSEDFVTRAAEVDESLAHDSAETLEQDLAHGSVAVRTDRSQVRSLDGLDLRNSGVLRATT